MNKKVKILIVMGLLVVAATVFFGMWNVKRLATGVKKVETENLAGTKMIFQPEGDGMSVKGQTGTGTPEQFVGAKFDTSSYAYKKDVCLNVSDRSDCFRQYYENLVKAYGSDLAFSDVKKRTDQDSFVASTCHPLTHIIGYAAAESYKTVSEAYVHGDSFCWSGYYHGVMEGIVARIGSEKLPKQLDTICADLPGKATYNFDYYNCVHGLGHGIMELGHDEVFDSLKMCDNLSGNWEQLSCQSGVFMENIIAENKNHYSKYLKPEEPLYPCNAVDYKYKDQCYLGQTSYALQVTNYNFKKIFELCATVDVDFRSTCNQSMGRDAANQAMHEKQKTKQTCALATSDQDETDCVIGAVKEIISYYHDITQAREYCGILDSPDKETCGLTAESYYKNF